MAQPVRRIRRPSFRRVVPALALAAMLAAPALPHARPALADHGPEHQPHARLELVVTRVHVLDDHDPFPSGSGELYFKVTFSVPGGTRSAVEFEFSADDGDTVQRSDLAGPLPVNPGQDVRVWVDGNERDDLPGESLDRTDDWLGTVDVTHPAAAGWGIGVHTASPQSVDPDYLVEYEIRRVPLPDLRIVELDGDSQLLLGQPSRVCAAVRNDGQEPAGPFAVRLEVGANSYPSEGKPGLGVGETVWACGAVGAMPEGSHAVAARVDPDHQLDEMDEYNNALQQSLTWGPRVVGPIVPAGPILTGPSGTSPKPDLVVTSALVGREENGTERCKEKSTAYIVAKVKNSGQSAAGPFVVRLQVNGQPTGEPEYLQSLAAGAETTVTFTTRELKEGPQTVRLLTDADGAVDEASEANNTRDLTADCKEDDD